MRFSLPTAVVLCTFIPIILSGVTPRLPRTGHTEHRHVDLPDRSLNPPKTYGNCTAANTRIRHEWRTLSKEERRRYIDAVLCLQKKPSIYKEVVGAKSRFDDFQIEHITQAYDIHFNAKFTAWHRWFVWEYESLLIQECGYQGAQPYWDWSLDGANITASPLFDGSPYSFGGNGDKVEFGDRGFSTIDIPGVVTLVQNTSASETTGGGCVTNGPFANLTIPFGPVGPDITEAFKDNPDNLKYRPHCITRDFKVVTASKTLIPAAVEALLASPNITAFNPNLASLGVPGKPNLYNLHGKGHLALGGDPQDFYSSPGDPLFYMHHTQVDRLWTLWQALDPSTRQYAISGTFTIYNSPPSPVFKLTDTLTLGKLSPGGPQPIRDFLNVKGGTPLCYAYA